MNKLLIKLLLTAATFLFYLLSVESLMQGYNLYLNVRYGTTNAETFLHEYDPIRGWKNKSKASGYFVVKNDGIKSFISINSKGLRGPEQDYSKPSQTKRVLILGDSMAAGFEVSESETVRARLESMLSKTGNWQVINAGTRGYGTDQSFLFLIEEGFRYQPDLIVYIFADNDLENNVTIHVKGKQYGKSYFILDQTGNLHRSGTPVPFSFALEDKTTMSRPSAQEYFDCLERPDTITTVPLAGQKTRQSFEPMSRIKAFLFDHSLVYQFVRIQLKQTPAVQDFLFRLGLSRSASTPPRPKAMLHAEWEIFEKLLMKMEDYSNSIDAKFAVLEVVNGFKTSKPAVELQKIVHEHSIPLIRSYEPFVLAAKSRGKLRWKDSVHWTARGHELAASLIYKFFKQQAWI